MKGQGSEARAGVSLQTPGLVRCSFPLVPGGPARVLKVKIAEGRALEPRHSQSLG